MMEKYESFKDSGLEWIGEIPSHWDFKSVKYIGSHIREKSTPRNNEIRISTDCVQSITGEIKNLYSDYGNDGVRFIKDDILFNKLGVHVHKLFHSEFEGFSMGEMIVIRIYNGNSKFIYYNLTRSEFIDYCSLISTGVTLKRVSIEDILCHKVVFPPIDEQHQIVSFLDTKTSLIDSLIEKTGRKIELLKEQRTSLINEVVTKGLNPYVEMKDSGVEWIGEIPSHWELPNLGLMTNLQQGLQIPFSDRLFEKEEGCYEYITTKSVHNPNDPKQYVKNPKDSVMCDYEDILFGRTGNTGEVVTKVIGVFHNNFFRIDFNRKKILKEYFLYYLTNSRFRENILLLAGTTTIPDLNHGDFYSCKLTLPPYSEQQQIVEYLDFETQLIDKTISNEEKRIELLKEYRQSLISEVVTGKIKVPEV